MIFNTGVLTPTNFMTSNEKESIVSPETQQQQSDLKSLLILTRSSKQGDYDFKSDYENMRLIDYEEFDVRSKQHESNILIFDQEQQQNSKFQEIYSTSEEFDEQSLQQQQQNQQEGQQLPTQTPIKVIQQQNSNNLQQHNDLQKTKQMIPYLNVDINRAINGSNNVNGITQSQNTTPSNRYKAGFSSSHKKGIANQLFNKKCDSLVEGQAKQSGNIINYLNSCNSQKTNDMNCLTSGDFFSPNSNNSGVKLFSNERGVMASNFYNSSNNNTTTCNQTSSNLLQLNCSDKIERIALQNAVKQMREEDPDIQIQYLKKEVTKLNQSLQEMDSQNLKQREKIENLNREINKLEEHQTSMQQVSVHQQQLIEKKDRELQSLKEERENIISKKEKLKDMLRDKDKIIQSYKSGTEQPTAKGCKDCAQGKAQLQSYAEENEQLKAQLANANMAIQQQQIQNEKQLAKLRDMNGVMRAKSQELSQLKNLNITLSDEVENLKNEIFILVSERSAQQRSIQQQPSQQSNSNLTSQTMANFYSQDSNKSNVNKEYFSQQQGLTPNNNNHHHLPPPSSQSSSSSSNNQLKDAISTIINSNLLQQNDTFNQKKEESFKNNKVPLNTSNSNLSNTNNNNNNSILKSCELSTITTNRIDQNNNSLTTIIINSQIPASNKAAEQQQQCEEIQVINKSTNNAAEQNNNTNQINLSESEQCKQILKKQQMKHLTAKSETNANCYIEKKSEISFEKIKQNLDNLKKKKVNLGNSQSSKNLLIQQQPPQCMIIKLHNKENQHQPDQSIILNQPQQQCQMSQINYHLKNNFVCNRPPLQNLTQNVKSFLQNYHQINTIKNQ